MNTKICFTNSTILLNDGRTLGYAEFGDPKGEVVFYFHGLPGSRLEAGHWENIACLNHYRLISIDRPGMGLSSKHPTRTILSWADDVEALANYLGIPKFSIIGHSGGAPFVAGCGYKIPHRLNKIAIVSGMGPFEIPEATASLGRGQRFINKMIKAIPPIATVMVNLMFLMLKKPGILKKMTSKMSEVDQRILGDTEAGDLFIQSSLEAFKGGITGVSQEIQLSLKPWGFDMSHIKCPVVIWQGRLDKQAPLAHANLYAKLNPNASLKVLDHEGHISLLINHGEKILRSVRE
ncbi:alpha/beta fold hydrolase [Legionella bononiensis]|uniref:Alpha/beta hydrolase n=1 Tax=Legionella bononiensis TaxID=2793102 RepID=A0ABS1WEN2_9GAMM|nr:alpha/beta hydrolase [Legionella bononiensis]MBL7478603.1 alpha/beta hydrolase [Legionella bononiensis]MBL7527803.1 alpha/beta hydrolase [Legionella bononiensis]MBL7563755.1 alpha/beta hydrolase [Legionella bononiensis]